MQTASDVLDTHHNAPSNSTLGLQAISASIAKHPNKSITHAWHRIRTNPIQIFFGHTVRSPGLREILHIAHECALMYNLADGD